MLTKSNLLPLKSLVWPALKIIITILLLATIGDYFISNPEIFTSLQQLSLLPVAAAVALDALAMLLFSSRAFLLLGSYGNWKIGYWHWFQIHIFGLIVGQIMPQIGDAYRAHKAKLISELPYSHYAGSFLLIAWMDMAILFVLAFLLASLVDVSFSGSYFSQQTLALMAIFWLLVAPAGTAILFLLARFPWLHVQVSDGLRLVLKSFWQSLLNLRLSLVQIALGGASFVAMTVMASIMFTALGSEIQMYQAALIIAVYKLSQAIILTPGNVGVREWSISGVCILLSLDPGHGLIFALLIRAIHIMALLTCGGSILLVRRVF